MEKSKLTLLVKKVKEKTYQLIEFNCPGCIYNHPSQKYHIDYCLNPYSFDDFYPLVLKDMLKQKKINYSELVQLENFFEKIHLNDVEINSD